MKSLPENTAMAKHLIVISYDAFSEDHWELASTFPNLSKLINNGAYSKELKSVYPTLTYVVHTTIATGVYPDKHGIHHNNPLQPFVKEEEQDWFWYREDIKVPTIYDAAREQHLNTAGLLWPVSGKSSIKYNIPEIRAIRNENQALKVLKNGSPLYCIQMEMKYGRLRKGIQQPYLDDFTTKCAIDTIKNKKPNLLMLHLIDLDDAKHAFGTDSHEVKQVIARMDTRLGEIIQAVEEAGIKEDTVFMVLGDHGQFNVRYKVHLNNLLQEKGLIFKENGEWRWRAYFQCGGGSAYLHIRQDDEEAELLALAAIEDHMRDEASGIEKWYTRDEMDHLHASKFTKYMLEAKRGYCFEEGLEQPTIVDLKHQGVTYATHGYSPDKPEYRCNMVVSGDKIKSGHPIGDVNMVDIAPTMAKILGIEFNACDGRALEEIFI
ncbi:Predicted pyrophosphatase or phosphodiesterase, AlkP superfamily [Fontibacillus panacisegetis]|uniref:Predicted pyrophosphatase or phosphodiesterase, AlkP superfamily n=1 Tax=Fontibacillus panacisegetis TaxID=670482 RepID=A0A1G7LX05_9BACL|nr:ectonucleotide pyrophosphatase/phosphodiesterase [Fontibacillus panacisegetis]SDF53914.1 Predicted pyrophosphatase or phosphodiesterase, AlkP superfamily [Fontibacillus panacisegetis]